MKKEKIKFVLEAYHCGMPINKIDPKGHGNGVRRLLAGKQVKVKTLDFMYQNVVNLGFMYNIIVPNEYKVEVYKNELNRAQKIKKVSIALENGVPKSKLDVTGHGDSIDKLETISDKKLHEIYNNLTAIEESKRVSVDQKLKTEIDIDILKEQVKLLTNKVRSLEQICNKQKQQIKELSNQQAYSKAKPLKVLGLTITLKTDIIRGTGYKRWYAIFKDNNKRRLIYIGKDRTKAQEKITAWFERNKKEFKS